VSLRCWKNGSWTSRTEGLSGNILLYNASGCSVAASVFQTLPELLGDTHAIPDTPRLYVCTRQNCCHRGSQITSARRNDTFGNYDEISAEVTSPRQVIDVNSLLHVNQASLLRQQRSCWHLIILTVLCASTVLGSLCFSLRFRLLTTILNCWTQNNVPARDCTEQIPNPTTSSPIQDTDEPKDDDLTGNVTFAAYLLRQAN